MSTNGAVVRLGEGDLDWLRGHLADQAVNNGGGGGDERAAAWFAAGDPDTYDLDGASLGVHFLLTGTERGGEGPLSFVANEAFGAPVRWASGHGRAFEPAAVAAIADAIEATAARLVRQRLESAALATLPPFSSRRLGDDEKEWLLAVLQGLMTFLRHAADDGVALLVTL